MNQQVVDAVCASVIAIGRIGPDEVRALRGAIFGEVEVTAAEANQLFNLAEKNLPACAKWSELFVEAISDYIVEQEHPRGYVSEENARWLISSIERDGRVWTDTELELVVCVLEKAISCPPRLVDFALMQIKNAVLSGHGVISANEVSLVRRVLYVRSGSGGMFVSRPEAEILFDLNDATLDAANDPAWSELFVKAIGNHILAESGAQPPTREEALHLEEWINDTSVSPGKFLRRMLSWKPQVTEASPAHGDADVIDAGEAEWLRKRILRNGRVDDNSRALLAFLQANAAEGQVRLGDLLRRA